MDSRPPLTWVTQRISTSIRTGGAPPRQRNAGPRPLAATQVASAVADGLIADGKLAGDGDSERRSQYVTKNPTNAGWRDRVWLFGYVSFGSCIVLGDIDIGRDIIAQVITRPATLRAHSTFAARAEQAAKQ